ILQRLILRSGKEFWSIGSVRGVRLLRGNHFVRQLRRLRWDYAQHRARECAHAQGLQNNPARNLIGVHKFSYRLPFFASPSRYSEARHESAMMVSVGFLSALLTKLPPSATNRFFTSCAWQN